MKNKEEVKVEFLKVVQSTVDMLCAASDWEDKAMMKALELGIQGEKRKNRLEGTGDNNIRKFLQCEAFDVFETPIYAHHMQVSFPPITDEESFFMAYREKMWEMYFGLHEAANTLVSPLCFKETACPLYERAACIKKDIVGVNRILARGRKLGFGHDLYIYETTCENVHDKYEEKEKKQGYKY